MSNHPSRTRLHEDWLTEETAIPETGEAPPFRSPGQRLEVGPGDMVGLPPPGARLDDFDLLRVLGSGSFARVYLARQVSLGRLVALKVSRNRGQEARTLAILEHDHIVRVFSESVDGDRDFRLLCMQYVAGTTLERLIGEMGQHPIARRNGRLLLDLIDRTATDPAALDLGALRDREALGGMDLVEACCWMAARLAEALAHAHGQKVLHRDVKPANVLVNRYGRPLLADFNIASAQTNDPSQQVFGGTVAYMAPEHLDAFNSDDFTPPDAVDARSDIWSLGAVLYEMLTGQLPYPLPPFEGTANEGLRRTADQRREWPPRLAPHLDAPAALERVVARCLAPSPADRYQDAAELAADLDSCRELRRVQRDLPPGRVITRFALRSPFLAGAVLMLLPQVIGTVVNITYNWLQIVNKYLNADQSALFWDVLIPAYDSFAYVGLFCLFLWQVLPVYRAWGALRRGEPIDAAAVDEARRQALRLPAWGFGLATFGWLAGGVLFPLLLGVPSMEGGVTVFRHFVFSFTISGLIAVTYSVLILEFVVVRALYPALWLDARKLPETASRELEHVEARVGLLQFLAVLIPLAGAAMMVGVGPVALDEQSYPTFRFLVTALLSLGMAGLGLAILAGSELRQTVAVLTSAGRKR
ncbi:MAG: serine/threonine-protein kinase [Gemmataceae bacterium]